jgi:dihydroorotate dehydrogenase electron transfer subunit
MKQIKAEIIKYERLAPSIYSIWLRASVITRQTKPGQFVMLALNERSDPFLARPLSIADIHKDRLRLIYRVVGKGTCLLQKKKIGESLYLLGPLGKPIKLIKHKNISLCAGGLGIAPLLTLAKKLSMHNKLHLYYGARTKHELILINEFRSLCDKIYLTTDDGSKGEKGLITKCMLRQISSNCQYLYAAGPLPMLKEISDIKFQISNMKRYVFLEERMGCGCGICFGCGVKKRGQSGYLRTCTDGPVFDLNEIEL